MCAGIRIPSARKEKHYNPSIHSFMAKSNKKFIKVELRNRTMKELALQNPILQNIKFREEPDSVIRAKSSLAMYLKFSAKKERAFFQHTWACETYLLLMSITFEGNKMNPTCSLKDKKKVFQAKVEEIEETESEPKTIVWTVSEKRSNSSNKLRDKVKSRAVTNEEKDEILMDPELKPKKSDLKGGSLRESKEGKEGKDTSKKMSKKDRKSLQIDKSKIEKKGDLDIVQGGDDDLKAALELSKNAYEQKKMSDLEQEELNIAIQMSLIDSDKKEDAAKRKQPIKEPKTSNRDSKDFNIELGKDKKGSKDKGSKGKEKIERKDSKNDLKKDKKEDTKSTGKNERIERKTSKNDLKKDKEKDTKKDEPKSAGRKKDKNKKEEKIQNRERNDSFSNSSDLPTKKEEKREDKKEHKKEPKREDKKEPTIKEEIHSPQIQRDPNVKIQAGTLFQTAMQLMEIGEFENAVPNLEKAITILITDPRAYQDYKSEIYFISIYYQAIHLFTIIQKFKEQKLYKQVAWILSKMYDIPLQQNHKIIIIQSAMKTNFILGNFNTTANLGKIIAEVLPAPESQLVQRALEKCKEENYRESYSPYPNPEVPLPICYQTGRVIKTSKYNHCTYCNANFQKNLDLQECKFCKTSLTVTTNQV